MSSLKVINNLTPANLELISSTLKSGDLVAIPTETVYGLAANSLNESAVEKIFKVKGRPADNPLIIHISNIQMIQNFAVNIPENLFKLAENFWPGPLTVILPKSKNVPFITTGGLNTVAIRMPNHPMALKIIEHSQLGLAAPSANISGKPSPTTAEHCINDIGNKIKIIVDGGTCSYGVESTVISLVEDVPTILRPGVITKEDIEKVIGETKLSKYVLQQPSVDSTVISPGVKYKHYAPHAEIILIKSDINKFANYVNSLTDFSVAALVFDDEQKFITKPCFTYGLKNNYLSQTKNLFNVLREIDKTNFKTIYARCPNSDGISLAVYNRLIRAAGFKVIDLDE